MREHLEREANRIAALLTAAEDRQMEAWDKPAGVQARIARTIAKHRRALALAEQRIERARRDGA
jgi:hypothetical protein